MQKTFPIDGPAHIEVRLASGEIEIDPTAQGSIEVELVAHDEESQRLVDDARVELNDFNLIVDVPQKRGGFNWSMMFGRQGVSCRIRCPHGSSVSVRTKSADVVARGTISGLNVSGASGDVEATRVEGGVNIKSASGDTRIDEVTGGVNIQTASGDVELETARGAINVASASGDVTVGVRRGSKVFLDCNTVSGDTSSELELTTDAPAGDGPLVEVRAKTVSGDIRITRAAAAADDNHTGSSGAEQEVHAS